MCNYVIDQIFNLHPQISICIFNYMYIISAIYQLILVISINKFLNEKNIMIETKMKNIYQLCLQLETYSKAGTPMKYMRKWVNASGDLIVDPYLKIRFCPRFQQFTRRFPRERRDKKESIESLFQFLSVLSLLHRLRRNIIISTLHLLFAPEKYKF